MERREERLHMKAKRFADFGKPGDMNTLIEELQTASGLEYTEVVKLLPKWIDVLTERQSTIIRLHYFMKRSVSEIRYDIGDNSNVDVNRSLEGGKKKLLKIAKEYNK